MKSSYRLFSLRCLWPLLSLFIGAVMGAMLGGNAKSVQLAPGPRQKAVLPSVPSSPAFFAGPISGQHEFGGSQSLLPPAIVRQFSDLRPLETARTLWLPAKVVDSMDCSFGGLDEKTYISQEIIKALGLTADQKKRTQAAVNHFLTQVRETEARAMQITEKTDSTLAVRIPAGLDITSPMRELEASLLPILGEKLLRILWPRLLRQMKADIPSASGLEFNISVTLIGDEEIKVKTSIGGGASHGESNFMPSKYKHLIQIVEEGDRPRLRHGSE